MRLVLMHGESLEPLGHIDLASWASRAAIAGNTVAYALPIGLLIIDLDDPSAPALRDYIPLELTPSLGGRDITSAGQDILALHGGSLTRYRVR